MRTKKVRLAAPGARSGSTQDVVKEDKRTPENTVSLLVDRLAAAVGEKRFQTWFDGRVGFNLAAGGELQVAFSNSFERDCVKRQFAAEIKQALGEVIGSDDPPRVIYHIDEAQAIVEAVEPTKPAADEVARPASSQDSTVPTAVSAGKAKPAAPNASFASIVVGESNHAAVSIAKQLAAGVFAASPLVIWGQTGSGKTQLLRAIQAEVRSTNRRCRCIYLTAEEFLSGFVDAVHGRGMANFRQRHRGLDLLLLDDISMLIGKQKTLEELQYTIDALVADGAQIVLASDRGPAELQTLGSELASRISAGVAVQLQTPDLTMRGELLTRIAAQRGVTLEPAAAKTIASSILGGARELTGIVNRLRYETQMFGDAVDEPLARRVAAEVNRQCTPRVSMSAIQAAICDVFHVEATLLKSNKRTKAASEPRMLAMWLSRKYTRNAWSEIGDFYGRSHSTVISACHRVEKLLAKETTVDLNGGCCAMQEALQRVEAELRKA